jgi:hypothetical protein
VNESQKNPSLLPPLMSAPPLIGWREWLGLPALGIPAVKAKVDTGARTSCLHSFHYEEFSREGRAWLRFWLHPLQHDTQREVVCEAPLLEKRMVRDSGGHRELRPVIQTPLQLGTLTGMIEITLTNREQMLFRMLLGRTALQGRYHVDPSASFLLGKPDDETLHHYYTPTSIR